MTSLIFMTMALAIVMANKVILFTRHGARSPKQYTELDTKYFWTIPAEDLTAKGLDQHIKLGARYQIGGLYDQTGKCIYENLEIQASTTERVMMSTIGFIKGLCPINYHQIIQRFFEEYYAQYSNDPIALEAIRHSDFLNPLELDLHHFERPNDFLFHGHKKTVCPAMKAAQKLNEKSDLYKSKEKEFKNSVDFDEVASIIKEAYPSKTIHKKDIQLSEIEDIYDDWYSNQFEGINFPKPSQGAIRLMEDVVKFIRYYVDNSQFVEHQAQLTEPINWLISQFHSDGEFSWYSGHDSNQVALLSVLTDEQFLPPFASELEILIRNGLISVYYNGQFLKTKLCKDGNNCTIQQAALYLQQFISNDLEALCNPPQFE